MFDALHNLMRKPRRWAASAVETLARVGAAIVWPIERLFAATAGQAFRIAEKFENVEDWLFGLWRLITWPLRMIWRLLAGLVSLIVPASLRAKFSGILGPWFRFTDWVGKAVWEFVEWLNLDAATRWLVWLLQPVWRPLAAVGGFFYAWFATRPYKQMLWGAPILVLLLPLGAIVTWGFTWGHSSVEAHYRAALAVAQQKNDLVAVDIFNRKLSLLGAKVENTELRRAMKLAEAGKLDEAYAIMKILAPEDKLGQPQAHSWILLQMLQGTLDVEPSERLRLADVHLKRLESLDLPTDQFKMLRAVWLMESGKPEEAAAMFAPFTSSNRLAAMQRMQINAQLNHLDEARSDARALRIHLDEAQRKGEALGPGDYQAWAQAAQLLDDSEEWSRAVRAWLKIDPQNKLARQSVVALDLLEVNQMLQSEYPNADSLAAHLIEITRLAEDTTQLEGRLTQMYANRTQFPGVEAMFAKLIKSPDAPLKLTAALGAAAALENDVPLARKLLARVVAEDPKHAVAWNNYAWALAQEPDSDLAKALDAVNHALEIAPEEFRFRETRGQTYLALERWQEAVDDLEFALNGMPDLAAIHASLATAYDKLGQTELADIHRQHVQ